jgi:hypothetical protein
MEAVLGFELPTAAKEGLNRHEYRQRKASRTIPKLQTALAPRKNAGVEGPGCVANCSNGEWKCHSSPNFVFESGIKMPG